MMIWRTDILSLLWYKHFHVACCPTSWLCH